MCSAYNVCSIEEMELLQILSAPRDSWYKKHDATTPSLPYEVRPLQMRYNVGKIIFGIEGIELLQYKSFSFGFKPKWTLNYSEIREVRTDCSGPRLKGLTLCLADEAIPNTSIKELHIPEIFNGRGQLTRTTLTVLRANALNATFTGPKWVEDGWVPRLGFSSPSNHPGGGGP